MRPHVIVAFGARPNFVKLAPVARWLQLDGDVHLTLVHTGQHYDRQLSHQIIADVDLRAPDISLAGGSGTHGRQTARILVEVERILQDKEPSLLVVGGDVNATLACALAAVKLRVPIAHVESGLRSFDWTMPEEVNRVLTDRMSDLLFTHSPEAETNLVSEGILQDRIRYVGNTMIDSLVVCEPTARAAAVWKRFGLRPESYVLVTLHRPSNVDDHARLKAIADALRRLSRRIEVVFPLHPRTRRHLETSGLLESLEAAGVLCTEPASYLEFLSLQIGASCVLTDSGGVQEETSALGVPCFTLRTTTERPITTTLGTNTLIGDDPSAIDAIGLGSVRRRTDIPLWDGRSAERIHADLRAFLDLPTTQHRPRRSTLES